MLDLNQHDHLACKIQYFAYYIQQVKKEKESLLLIITHDSCDKEQLKTQIVFCEELLKEYYDVFQNIVYR
jgi:hypothetical protein